MQWECRLSSSSQSTSQYYRYNRHLKALRWQLNFVQECDDEEILPEVCPQKSTSPSSGPVRCLAKTWQLWLCICQSIKNFVIMSLLCSCYMVLTDETAKTPELVCLFLVMTFTICWFQAAAALGAGKRKSSESTEAVAAHSSSPKVRLSWVFFFSSASASV